MARKRMIDPAIWSDSDLGDVSRDARLLFIGMMSLADDEGRIEANPRYLRKEVFGYDDDLTVAGVAALMDQLRQCCRNLQFYEHEGREYIVFVHWERYQRIEKPYRSKLPNPPGYVPNGKLREWSTTQTPTKRTVHVPADDDSTTIPVTVVEHSPQEKKEKEKRQEKNNGVAESTDMPQAAPASPPKSPTFAALFDLGLDRGQCHAILKKNPTMTLGDVELWKAWMPTCKADNPVAIAIKHMLDGRKRPPNAISNAPPPDIRPRLPDGRLDYDTINENLRTKRTMT